MLSAETKITWTPGEIHNLAMGGLYSEDGLEDYIGKISFPIERDTILENAAQTISKTESETMKTITIPLKLGIGKT